MTYEIIRATRTDAPAGSVADMYELARAVAQVRSKQQPIIIIERVRPVGPNTALDHTLKNLVSAPLGYSHSTLLFCMPEVQVRDPEHMKGAFCYGGWNQVAEIPEVLVPGEESLPRIRFQFDDGRHFVVDEDGQSGRLLKSFLKTFGDLGFAGAAFRSIVLRSVKRCAARHSRTSPVWPSSAIGRSRKQGPVCLRA